ncbi:MAG: hypothetical protein Q9195_002501 [Heterodermia aff. obscurata]
MSNNLSTPLSLAQPGHKRRRQAPPPNDHESMLSIAGYQRTGTSRAVSTGGDVIEKEYNKLKSCRKPASSEATVTVEESCLQDDTRIDGDIERSKEDVLSQWAMKYLEDPGLRSGPLFPYWKDQPDDLEAFHKTQRLAGQRIKCHLDSGRYRVQLSSLKLQAIQPSILRPLRDLPSQVSSYTPQTHCYGPQSHWDRRFWLALNRNQLTELPEEIYNLTYFHGLDFESNSITEILPSIKHFRQLEVLDLSKNRLNWLPFEIFQLLPSTFDISLFFPNPYVRPLGTPCLSEDEFCSTQLDGRREASLMSRTRTAYLSISGLSVPGWLPSPSECIQKATSSVYSASMRAPTAPQKLRTPSLFEVALRGCYRCANLAQLPFLLPSQSPPSISRALKMTWRVKASGGQEYSVCGKFYIVPRTEWLEWWHERCAVAGLDSEGSSAGESSPGGSSFEGSSFEDSSPEGSSHEDSLPERYARPVPYIRRGCSWACAPDEDYSDGKVVGKDGVEIEIATGWTLP